VSALRRFEEGDIPAVASLFGRVFLAGRSPSPAADDYYREIFFRSPLRDPELTSLVAEASGRVVGFVGVVPRRMSFRGRPLRVAVTTQFMVEPEQRHTLVAVDLLRRLLAGPQDLCLADAAGREGQRLWEALGGQASLLYRLHWTRPLRPYDYVLSVVRRRPGWGALGALAAPLAWAGDLAATGLSSSPFAVAPAQARAEEVSPHTLVSQVAASDLGCVVQPVYDEPSLRWLFGLLDGPARRGTLYCALVPSRTRTPGGWFAFFLRPDRVADVVLLYARPTERSEVLGQLFEAAGRLGAIAMRGRMEPAFAEELNDAHAFFRCDGPLTLLHSPHSEVLSAFHQGQAFFSRLDGEWWINFRQRVSS